VLSLLHLREKALATLEFSANPPDQDGESLIETGHKICGVIRTKLTVVVGTERAHVIDILLGQLVAEPMCETVAKAVEFKEKGESALRQETDAAEDSGPLMKAKPSVPF
jgi:hypothetical protein